jgi:hypothetical protein
MTLPAGIHYDVPEATYRNDPGSTAALSQSIAKILLSRSPAHAWLAHPRLNPNWEPDNQTKYDVGNIVHKLMLGRGRDLVVLPFDDWRTKDARTARDEALAGGKLAVLDRDMDLADAMVSAAWRQLQERGYAGDWKVDKDCGEVVVRAMVGIKDAQPGQPLTGYWLTAMIDWLPTTTRIWDWKTTAMSVAPDALGRLMAGGNWPLQAATHERILNILDPGNIGRREHRFVTQEVVAPHALSVVRLTEAHMTIGRAQLARAEAIWARCMATDTWPMYPVEDQTPEYPAWAMQKAMEEGDGEI